jgi:hypothetical protein
MSHSESDAPQLSEEAARWFEADLQRCPQCGEARLVPGTGSNGLRVCLTCGMLPAPDPQP